MTLAFLSGFKYLGPGTGNDQGGSRPGSWVCVSGWHALLISAGPAPSSSPHFLPLSHSFPAAQTWLSVCLGMFDIHLCCTYF